MLQAILEAIMAGARRAFGVVSGIIMWPLTLFGGGGGRRAPSPDMTTVAAAEKSLAAGRAKDSVVQSTLRDSDFKRDAQIAWGWITTTMLTRTQMPFPSQLSKKMQGWLQGLDYSQLEMLRNAGAAGICEHFAGTKTVTGVPSVKPLAPVTLRFPPIKKSAAEISDFGFSLSR